jgi:hypothetical protein
MTTNYVLERYAKDLGIRHFRGVFMKDVIPKRSRKRECGIVNLQNQNESGSHWVGYFKNEKHTIYFDSYGADPPVEVKQYLGKNVFVSTFQIQDFGTSICGELCLYVLKRLNEGEMFVDIILSLLYTIINDS